jgi:hypothetical protein
MFDEKSIVWLALPASLLRSTWLRYGYGGLL